MKNGTKITSISTVKARNLMRGMISNSEPHHAVRTLEKIRKLCSEADFRQALLVLRGSDIFKQNAIGRDFNRSFPRLVGPETGAVFSPNDIISKIHANIKKISELIEINKKIIEEISIANFPKAIENCRLLIDHDGASIASLRYLHFIKNHVAPGQDLAKEIDEILSQAKVENIRYISSVIRELSSGRTDYFNIIDRVTKADWSISVSIARTFIDFIPRSQREFATTFSSLYYISIFDAFLYLARLQTLELPYIPILDINLTNEFYSISKSSPDINKFYETDDEWIGSIFFRESFLLFELEDWFKYRITHAALFNLSERKEDHRSPYERELLHTYFKEINKIADIGVKSSTHRLCLHRYIPNESCHFQNSSALVYLLERSDGDIGDNEIDFVRLMSLTREIGIICPQQYIESIKINAKSSELKIVAHALSHIKKHSQMKEHELRAVLQAAATDNFDGNYTNLLDYFYNISPAVAAHLVQCSDETFLSKLFQIMGNPNAAIQERANILEWYGSKIGDSTYSDRAKNLRIDVQINKERGTIDDSRIYVDPVKFTQWVNNQVLDKFTILLESLPQPVEPVLVPLNWEKVKTGIDTYEQLASLILQCYEEFCSNNVYGIASYLGRRIRHGTLKGTGYNDVSKFFNDSRFSSLFEIAEFKDAYIEWLKNYEIVLNDLRDKYLYIQNKNRPDGLISLEFRSTPKRTAANHLLHDILKSFSVNKSCAEFPYLILEYCWRIIEEDLANIRKIVMERKAQYGVFRASYSLAQHCKHRELQDFCQDLNSIAVERFRTIELWFNKPSIASPSADVSLLFKAVVSEVKSQFQNFQPILVVDELGFMLNGGAYHVIYDALFILIYNAAENGKSDGLLKMNLTLDDVSGKKHVTIKITSEIQPDNTMPEIVDSINSALGGDCEDALVLEGRSGIKKLRRMEQAGYIQDVSYSFSNNTVQASFSFGLDY